MDSHLFKKRLCPYYQNPDIIFFLKVFSTIFYQRKILNNFINLHNSPMWKNWTYIKWRCQLHLKEVDLYR